MVCAGSLRAEMARYQDRAGQAAAAGTVAHDLAEQWLRTGRKPKGVIGKTRAESGFLILVDEEMMSYVQEYVEWCLSLGPADEVVIEKRVDFSDLTPLPGQGGTADHGHLAGGVLTITDLKMGTAHRVYARENKQARLYAYGLWRDLEWAYDIHTIVIRICQPRLEVFETWTITLPELLAFAAEAKRAAHNAWSENAPRTPSPEACKYCSLKADCPAFITVAERLADEMMADLGEPLEVQPETVSVPAVVLQPRSDPSRLTT